MKRGIVFAVVLLLAVVANQRGASAAEYGFQPGTVSAAESSLGAGAHPDLDIDFELTTEESGNPVASTKEIKIAMPAGLTGNPNSTPRCTLLQLVSTNVESPTSKNACPVDSQVGITEAVLFNQGGLHPLIEPIFNMEPPDDGHTVARLGFYAQAFPTIINIRVRSESDYGLTASLEGIGSLIPLVSATTTIWGVPAEKSHDSLRITPYEALHCNGAPCTAPGEQPRQSGLVPAPFLSNPTQCEAPQRFEITATSYAEAGPPAVETVELPAPTGCAKLSFAPTFTATSTSREASAPTGLDAELNVPQDETVKGRSTSQLRDARVLLPPGMTVAPGAADGLGSCSEEQVGYRSAAAAQCPDAAKIGTAEIDVPALARPIDGAVYQRTPEPGHLFRIWLVADELGVHLALPGEIELNPVTGQITSLFLETPQAPVRDIGLHFKSGPRAPLANPSSCGTHWTHYEFTPWSLGSPAVGETAMVVDRNCATGGFDPKLVAGSADPSAGAFSAFVTDLIRESSEQNVSGLSVRLPRGVLAKLAGVGLCDAGSAPSGSCPAASQVGVVAVASGPGSNPLWIPQPGKAPTAIYLSGPYQGAPYGLVVKVPAQAGPFDLGTVVTRAAIYVDPESAEVTVKSDPLPQILEGVPISYRSIDVEVDRPRFALNPTGCGEKNTRATVASAAGAVASPASRFQLRGCGELGFKPRLALTLSGGTGRGAHPALTARLTPRRGDANIARAQVALPHSEFLDQGHIGTVCTRVQFGAGKCPAGSVYGHATAWTPLLGRPLDGPVYLRSSNHILPDLVADLTGQIHIVLDGRIDSVNGGIRSTFAAVPDAPVSKFILSMRGGRKGLLENSTDLCAGTHRAIVRFTGHNGKSRDFRPALASTCTNARNSKRRGN